MGESKSPELVEGLRSTVYVYEGNHFLLHSDAWKEPAGTIGTQGRNLTISFLSRNRAVLSQKLLASIAEHLPGFQGEVLVVDNGSDPDELARVKEAAAALKCSTRVIELGQNYGVGGARNRTIPHVRTEWLMCLDNDIFFIENPLDRIQRDLAVLGCHFLSLPLLNPDRETLFALGGHLYVSHSDGVPHLGAGSAYRQSARPKEAVEGFLGTFLFGGSCVLKVRTFQEVGGYDENMFVGFEDLDFSMRLFQRGLKVGSSGVLALVHDHPAPSSDVDVEYERQRFSKQVLKSSAEYLTSKHGFEIWSDAVSQWLDERHDQLGLPGAAGGLNGAEPLPEASARDEGRRAAKREAAPQKPKIALILDTDNWAFGNIARQLEKNLSDRFSFMRIPMDVIDNIDQVFLMAQQCQILHFFWREHLTLIGTPYYQSYAEILTGSYEAFYKRFIEPKILSTSVYDHLLLEPQELERRREIFTGRVAGYTVASQKLNAIYSVVPGYPKPSAVIEDGVDLAVFRPKNIERLKGVSDRELVVGWVGNSKWASEIEDFKGVHTILKPALEQLVAGGAKVRAHFADRQERFIPHDKMPDYYSEIDVLVCTSKIEGTPNPVLEAMACGVPVVTTDVGIVPQAFGPLQRDFILPSRSIDCLVAKLRQLREEPHRLLALSAESLERIAAWDWPAKAKLFGDYFDALLAARQLSKGVAQGVAA